MSFNDEIKKSASEKFCLVRLGYSSLLSATPMGSNLFSVSINDYIFELYCDDVKLTKVSGIPTSGQYSVSSDLKTATLYSANPDPSVIAKMYFYATNDKNRVIGRDPTSPNVDLIEWPGRLKNNPSFSQSVENLQSGKLTMSVSEIQLINHDGKYDFLKDSNNYLSNMLFDVWFCCNGVENITYGFSGISVEASQQGSTLTIKTKDTLNRLEKKCFMGDSESECYFSTDVGGSFQFGDPSKNKRPIPYITGKTTDYRKKTEIVLGLIYESYEQNSLREALCSNFSTTIATNTNREYVTHRTDVGFSFVGTISSSANPMGGYDFLMPTAEIASNFLYGDTFKHGTTYLFTRQVTNNVVTASVISGPIPSASAVMDFNSIPLVIIERSDTFYYCVYGRDYSISYSATSSGNRLYKITFVTNFEANVGLPSAINPTEDVVRFRAHSIPVNHDAAVLKILNDANIPCSFTGTYSSYNVCFGVPTINESDFGPCLEYLEKVLESNVSFIYQGGDGVFDYGEFITPTNPQEITSDDYILGSLREEENSQDIFTNATVMQETNKDNGVRIYSSTVETLIGTKRYYEFESVNEDYSPKIQVFSKLFKKTNSFLFSTKKVGYDFVLGKFVKIKNKNLTVVSLQKSIDKIDIVATDTYTY